MSEIQCLKVRLEPGTTERVAGFLRGLRERESEVVRSLEAEGIISESLFLDRTDGGDFLIFVTRAADLEAAAAAFQRSTLPLDVETRRLIADTWADVEPLELLADLERPER